MIVIIIIISSIIITITININVTLLIVMFSFIISVMTIIMGFGGVLFALRASLFRAAQFRTRRSSLKSGVERALRLSAAWEREQTTNKRGQRWIPFGVHPLELER